MIAPPTNLLKAGTSVLAFDLDGTLVDSVPDLAYSLGRALEAQGFRAPTEDETRSWVGDGVEELVRRALAHAVPLDVSGATPSDDSQAARDDAASEALVAAVLDAFSRCYADNLFVRSRLYRGVVEALDTLRSRGFRLCCVTSPARQVEESRRDRRRTVRRRVHRPALQVRRPRRRHD